MRGRAGACVADFQQDAAPERIVASADKMAGALYRLALEHCARGGTEREFVVVAQRQAARAFADTDAAGVARDVRVLGLGADGRRRVKESSSGPEGLVDAQTTQEA